ncbi:MAG: hypothetical protein WC511_00695 [Candidatus Pacearchaeota archaeon]|jgi:hypothetical protein
MKTLGETITALKERWGEHDSDFLYTDEVKEMSPEKRKAYLEGIANLYFEADSENSRAMIQAQREAYSEGNCNFYLEGN